MVSILNWRDHGRCTTGASKPLHSDTIITTLPTSFILDDPPPVIPIEPPPGISIELQSVLPDHPPPAFSNEPLPSVHVGPSPTTVHRSYTETIATGPSIIPCSPSKPSRWLCSLGKWLKSKISRPHGRDVFEREVDLILVRNGREVKHTGIASFDTMCTCEHDIISMRFAELYGLVFDDSTKTLIGESVTGEPIYRIGTASGRWHCGKDSGQHASKGLWFRKRYEHSYFDVVDMPNHDMIIGRRTIERLRLYKPNRGILAPFRGLTSRVNSSTASEQQKQADERRQRDKEERKRHEQQKKAHAQTQVPPRSGRQ